MDTARIFQKIKSSTSSGKGRLDTWVLEIERSQGYRADPLTGWAGSGDTSTQVTLQFDSLDAAVAYAERKGLVTHIVRSTETRLKLQTYADNFR